MLPDGADGANHDRQVEHHVGTEDRPDAAIERVRQQRGERRSHHDRGQHERGREEPEQQPPADEPEPGEHVGRGDADDERQDRAGQCLPGGEPRHLPCAAPPQHVSDLVDGNGFGEQCRERHHVEHDEEHERRRRDRRDEPSW